MKCFVIEITHAPYQTGDRARIGLELAMGLSAFDHQVSVLLIGNGIANLCASTDPPPEPYHKTFTALPLYDVTLCFRKTDVKRHRLTEPLPNDAIALSDKDITIMKQQADIVLCP